MQGLRDFTFYLWSRKRSNSRSSLKPCMLRAVPFVFS